MILPRRSRDAARGPGGVRSHSAIRHRARAGVATLVLASTLGGCGANSGSSRSTAERVAPIPRALRLEARPIGKGQRFHPALREVAVSDCKPRLGPRIEAHVELFAANRVLLLPAGIGTRPPRKLTDGRVSRARCYGAVVTLEPTGIVFVRRSAKLRLADLFSAWGEPLSSRRLASFAAAAGKHVTVFVDGRRWRGAPGTVPLREHAEIVVEIGPHVPPHHFFTFPPGP